MVRIRLLSAITVAALVVCNVVARSGELNGEAHSSAAATGSSGASSASSSVTADADARADLERHRRAIERRAAETSANAIAKAQKELDAAKHSIEAKAERGANTVAGLLATEFGTSTEAMLSEKSELRTSWGDLTIAHTLAANANTGVTAAQLVQLQQSGMGWGQIAAGLGMHLGSAVSSVKAEARVANGLAKADGQVAAIATKAPNGELAAGANGRASVDTHQGVGAHTDVGAGMGVKLGR